MNNPSEDQIIPAEEDQSPIETDIEDQDEAPAQNPTQIIETGIQLNQLLRELNELFPEREHLITQIVMALLTKEHVLVHGIYGTGKSALLMTLFNAFPDADKYSISLTKFMSESHVIGIPDPKEMRETGVMRYRPEGGILRAQLVELDEIFDANAPLLRTLLTVLNERMFKRGQQVERAFLHTAVAATNGEPDAEVQKSPDLAAVVDRFIYQCKVTYLTKEASRLQMYRNFATKKAISVSIPYNNLLEISQFVIDFDESAEDDFLLMFDKAVQMFRSKVARKYRPISDRRACKMLKLCTGNALLNGRDYLIYDDLKALRWGLCMGGEDGEHKIFLDELDKIIESAKDKNLEALLKNEFPKARAVENLQFDEFFEFEASAGDTIEFECKAVILDQLALIHGVDKTQVKSKIEKNDHGEIIRSTLIISVADFDDGNKKVIWLKRKDNRKILLSIKQRKRP